MSGLSCYNYFKSPFIRTISAPQIDLLTEMRSSLKKETSFHSSISDNTIKTSLLARACGAGVLFPREALLLDICQSDSNLAASILYSAFMRYPKSMSACLKNKICRLINQTRLGLFTSAKEEVLMLLQAFKKYPDRQDELARMDFSKLTALLEGPNCSIDYLRKNLIHFVSKDPISKGNLKSFRLCEKALSKASPIEFKIEFQKLLSKLLASSEGLRKMYLSDLLEFVSTHPESTLFTDLHNALLTQKLLDSYSSKIVDLSQDILKSEQTDQAMVVDGVYRKAVGLFSRQDKDCLLSPTKFSQNYGLVFEQLRKLDALFSNKAHKLCACDLSSSGKIWPLAYQPFVKRQQYGNFPKGSDSVAILGCSFGTGHKQAASNASILLEKMGYHCFSIDLAGDILFDADPVTVMTQKIFGKFAPNWSIGTLFNALASRKAFALLNFLSGKDLEMGIEPPSPSASDVSFQDVKKITSLLLKIRPSLVVVNYYPDIAAVIESAKVLNLPLLHTHTDISPRELKWRVSPGVYKGFKEGLAIEGYDHLICPNTVSADQIKLLGPPSNPIYDHRLSMDEILECKDKWKIDRDKRVLVISNGGVGSSSVPVYLDFLVERYKDTPKEMIPFHVVMICGATNDALKEQIDEKFSSLLPISTYKSVPPNDMKELMSMASAGGGLVGKAGGLTAFESIKLSTPIIIDQIFPRMVSTSLKTTTVNLLNWLAQKRGNSNILSWEKENRDYLVDKGLGSVCQSKEDFFSILDKMLKSPHTTPIPQIESIERFSDNFPRVVQEMIDEHEGIIVDSF